MLSINKNYQLKQLFLKKWGEKISKFNIETEITILLRFTTVYSSYILYISELYKFPEILTDLLDLTILN